VEASDNIERLRKAGLIDDSADRLPDEYYSVIEQMTKGEVEALASLMKKIADAGIPTGPLTASYIVEVRLTHPMVVPPL